ncbi:MAG: hypothetical protein WBA51_16655 [Erythrobacter sp.]
MPVQYSFRWLAAAAFMASTTSLAIAAPDGFDEADLAATSVHLCNPDEALIFAGVVRDDFGLGIAVCIAEQDHPEGAMVTVRYSGEGGGREISCRSVQCDGIIEFSHYVRPRFTVLTLKWRDENGEQELVESFDAQDGFEHPVHSVRHRWAPRSNAGSSIPTHY